MLRKVPVLALALAALAVPASAAAADTDWLALRGLHITHQGGEDEAPSATIYALDRAMRLGADMLEVDVHTSADGHLVVIHDGTVDRTTDGSGSVYDMTLRQLQALDAGHDIVPGEGIEGGRPASDYAFRGVRTGKRRPPPGYRPRDFRIPTLPEVMRRWPNVPINIEIKGAADTDAASFQRNAEALAAFLNRIGRSEGIIVASFNDAALARFHQLAPQIDLAPAVAATGAYKLGGVRPPEGTVAFQVPIEFGGVTVVDEAFVERAHADGYAVHVWTINEESEMRQLLDWGVDGIMTAEPIRLERVLCRRGVERPSRPAGLRGGHCNSHASIACDVDAVRATRAGARLRVVLRRRDGFTGRCAGVVAVRGEGAVRKGRFGFGWKPPADGGPRKRVVRVALPRRLRPSVRPGGTVRLTVRPYTAFAEGARLRVRRAG
jgi:glycerophosphoryl diester phosphodiesterase